MPLDRELAAGDLLSQGGKSSDSSPGGLYFARDFVKAKDDPEDKDAHDLVNRADSVDEFTITYSKVFLGINVGCISCHAGRAHLDSREYAAVANVGSRPTFGEEQPLIEVHLLDFAGDIYGRQLAFDFVERVRPVQRFGSLDELRAQIGRDIDQSRELVGLSPPTP